MRLGKVSEVNAKYLRTYFPASTSVPRKRSCSAFDPLNDCIFSQEQKRKKGARVKPVQISVFVANPGTTCVPRGAWRKELIEQKHLVRLELKRNMSSSEVRVAISNGITHLNVSQNFIFLECAGHQLKISSNQQLNGDDVIESAFKRKGAVLYVSDKTKVYIVVCLLPKFSC